MTIKFERFADNYMCKYYFYDIWDDEDAKFRSGTVKKITMSDYEFEQLFKDMANELGYYINKCKPGICCYPCCNQSILLDSQYCKEHMYNDEEYSRRYIKPKSESNDNVCKPVTNEEEYKQSIECNLKGCNIPYGFHHNHTKSESEHKLELRLDKLEDNYKTMSNAFATFNDEFKDWGKDIEKAIEELEKKQRATDNKIDNLNKYIVETIMNKIKTLDDELREDKG